MESARGVSISHRKRFLQKRQEESSTTSFFVSDSSPLIHYSASNGTSSWQPAFARQPDGFDETLHLTTSSTANLSFNVSASSLTFLVPAFENCAATVSINDSTAITACSTKSDSGDIPFGLSNLPFGTHRVRWSVNQVPDNQQVIFWGIDGTRLKDPEGYANVTIDDAFSQTGPASIKYDGTWDRLTRGTGGDDMDARFNQTLAITKAHEAKVTFTGQGSAIYLYGSMGPEYGSASVSLNGQIVAPNMNLSSPWEMNYQLLWFSSLDPTTQSEITMTNLASSAMSIDFVVLTSSPETIAQLVRASSTPFISTLAGKLVVGLVVPAIVLILLAILLLVLCSVRRRRAATQQTVEGNPHVEPYTGAKTESSWPSRSSPTTPSVSEVFVSYDEARSQRMSDRWNSPHSPPSSRTFGSPSHPSHRNSSISRIPVPTLAESPETTPTDDTSSAPSWSRPLRSMFGTALLATPQARRHTELPAYSPKDETTPYVSDDNSTIPDAGPAGPSAWPSASAEKHLSPDAKGLNRRVSTATRLERHASTIAPSSIYSVFGAPPSVRHPSISGDFHSDYDSVPVPARPRVITDILKHTPSLESAIVSAQSGLPLLSQSSMSGSSPEAPSSGASDVTGLTPPSAFHRVGYDGREVRKSGSSVSLRSEGSAGGVAKPDSAVMPYTGSTLSTRH